MFAHNKSDGYGARFMITFVSFIFNYYRVRQQG